MLIGHVRSCDSEWVGHQLQKMIQTESDGEVAPQMKIGILLPEEGRMGAQ